jgi:hypothetical protein
LCTSCQEQPDLSFRNSKPFQGLSLTVPPLLQVANAALMAGASSEVPPGTSHVSPAIELTPYANRIVSLVIEKDTILCLLVYCKKKNRDSNPRIVSFIYGDIDREKSCRKIQPQNPTQRFISSFGYRLQKTIGYCSPSAKDFPRGC